MRIADIETFVVANPRPDLGGPYFVFVKLTTDDGIVGYGEHYGATFRPPVVEAMLEDLAGALLIGRDPFLVERFCRSAYGRGFTARPDVTLGGAISALEMACWDIIGKAVDKPVHALLGGRVRDAVRSYTYIYDEPGVEGDAVYRDPELAARRAAAYVANGFTALKFDPAGPYSSMGGYQPLLERIELSARFCSAIREAVGTDADILFGTPRAVHARRRDPAGGPAGALRSAVVRGAGPAGRCRGHGHGPPAHLDTHCRRGAAYRQGGVRPPSGRVGG